MSQASDNNGYESIFHTLPRAPLAMGKYEILEEIGRGSMGTVYAAYDPFADRIVAIKIANSRVDGKEDHFRKLFFNEVHAAGVLEQADQATRIRFLKVFAEIVVQRQARSASGLSQR